VRQRLFDVGISPGFDRLDGMICVLKIRSGDHDRINIFARIQFIVVASRRGRFTCLFLQECYAFVAAVVPDIRNGHELEVQFLRVLHEGRSERAAEAIGKTDYAHSNAIVCSGDPRVTGRGKP
jgi:hypothetical protein